MMLHQRVVVGGEGEDGGEDGGEDRGEGGGEDEDEDGAEGEDEDPHESRTCPSATLRMSMSRKSRRWMRLDAHVRGLMLAISHRASSAKHCGGVASRSVFAVKVVRWSWLHSHASQQSYWSSCG